MDEREDFEDWSVPKPEELGGVTCHIGTPGVMMQAHQPEEGVALFEMPPTEGLNRVVLLMASALVLDNPPLLNP